MRKVYVDSGKRKQKVIYQSYIVESSFVQMYLNAGDIFFKLRTPTAYNLLIWIVLNMNSINGISLNKNNRGEFIAATISNGGKRYADNTVKQAIRELVDVGILITENDEKQRLGSYMINPFYFWKSKHQSERLQLIESFKFKKENNERNSI